MGRRAVDKATGEPFLISLMTGKERAVYGVIATLWVSSVAAFWLWWLRPEHNIDNIRFLINSVLLFWTTVIPGYFFLVFALSRVPNKAVNLPTQLRVAMVVTKAPSEPFDVVRRTRAAMLAQDYPHDTWLADEVRPTRRLGGAPGTTSPFPRARTYLTTITKPGQGGKSPRKATWPISTTRTGTSVMTSRCKWTLTMSQAKAT